MGQHEPEPMSQYDVAMVTRVSAVAFRFVFAGLSLTAVFYQFFAVHVPGGYSVVNFFLYFTNLSNILISVVFIGSALRLLTRRARPSVTDTAIRGASVVYLAFVGLVFNTLLRDVDLSGLTPWVNVVLHVVMPIAAIIDWIAWSPDNRLRWRVIGWWMVFPAAYAIFSVIRGALDGFYPYPFFNPSAVGGYGAVGSYSVAMIIGFLILAVATRAVGNARASSSQSAHGPSAREWNDSQRRTSR